MTRYLALFILCSSLQAGEYVLPAFPGAEGWGMGTSGGRGGRVIYVTNTNSAGDGSFSNAVAATGARTVIIKTNGWCTLTSGIRVTTANSDLTLYGGLAPGDGFGVRATGGAAGGGIVYDYNNAPVNWIVRYMRFRPGSNTSSGFNVVGFGTSDFPPRGATNHIWANCSFSWSVDDNFGIPYGDMVTLQDNIFSEGFSDLGDTSNRQTWLGRNKGLFIGGNSSVIRNFFSDFGERIPYINWGTNDIRYNVIWNPYRTFTIGRAGQTNHYNLTANYIKPGPVWLSSGLTGIPKTVFYNLGTGVSLDIYFSGNVTEGYAAASADNSLMIINSTNGVTFRGTELTTPFVTAMTVTQAVTYVTNNAGATLPVRDSVDERKMAEYNGQAVDGDTWYGMLESEDDVGGYPALATGTPYTDTDTDGMLDSWEEYYWGNIGARDGKSDADGDGYTDLEEFLYNLNPLVYVDYYVDFYTGELRSGEEPVPDPDPPPVEGTAIADDGLTEYDGLIEVQ